MSYNADLLNAYREQLAKIREANAVLHTARDNQGGFGDGDDLYATYDLLDAAINDQSVYDLEHLYDFKGPALILPDGSGFHTNKEGYIVSRGPYEGRNPED
jgi:hypothetical protein